MQKFRFHLIFALCFGVIVAAMSWLLISPDSPVESLSIDVKAFFGGVQIIAALLAVLFSGNIHGGSSGEIIYWFLVFCQWSIVGLVLSFLFGLLKGHKRRASQ